MSHQPTPPTARQLAGDCHRLISQLEAHRLNVRLLLGARDTLQRFADYKSTRRKASRPRRARGP